MPNKMEINLDELEYVLTEALLAIQGVALSEEKKTRVEHSIQDFLRNIPQTKRVMGHKTPLNLNPVF